MPNYYPIMLDVRGREALVIGGNSIAAEKAASLCNSGARVSILSPEFCEALQAMAARGEVTLRTGAYEPGMLAGAFIVVAAINDSAQIAAIWQEAQQRGQLLNIVDVPAYCNFIVPSILRRDQLTIAVSTEGATPGLAKRIRQQLEALFPPTYGLYIRLAARARAYLRRHQVTYAERDHFFGDFFASDILEQLREGDEKQATKTTSELLARYDIAVPDATLYEELQTNK